MNRLSVWVSDEWSESISVIVSGLMGFIGFEIWSTPENRQKPICRLNYTFPISTSAACLHLRWLTHKHTQMYADTLHCLIFHTQRHHVSTSVEQLFMTTMCQHPAQEDEIITMKHHNTVKNCTEHVLWYSQLLWSIKPEVFVFSVPLVSVLALSHLLLVATMLR